MRRVPPIRLRAEGHAEIWWCLSLKFVRVLRERPIRAFILERFVEDLADRIIPHYERHAHAWDADRRRAGWNDKPWQDRFVTNLPMGASVLDLGCGSGAPVALNMAACGLAVTGIDASPSLISLCRERMPGQRWIVGDMRSPRSTGGLMGFSLGTASFT